MNSVRLVDGLRDWHCCSTNRSLAMLAISNWEFDAIANR
jgi:hypothetical protein